MNEREPNLKIRTVDDGPNFFMIGFQKMIEAIALTA